MVRLTVGRLIEQPTRAEWQTDRPFSSEGSPWVARFYDPFEWHMGAEGWSVALLRDGDDATARHPYIAKTRTGKGYYLPHKYHPWCSGRAFIALYAWDDLLRIYDVEKLQSVERRVPFPMEIQWSPKGEVLAVTHAGHIGLADAQGRPIANVPVRHPQYEYPELFWWPDGKSFFVVSRTSPMSKTTLAFFNAADGREIERVNFDPADLLPYDAEKYKELPRDGYSLRIGRGARSVGYLLDKWARIRFDPAQQLLSAFVYRPVSECERVDNQLTCDAEERGVEVAVGV